MPLRPLCSRVDSRPGKADYATICERGCNDPTRSRVCGTEKLRFRAAWRCIESRPDAYQLWVGNLHHSSCCSAQYIRIESRANQCFPIAILCEGPFGLSSIC